MNKLDERIKEIKERMNNTTPGPWINNKYDKNIRNYAYEKTKGAFHIARYPTRQPKYPISHEEWEANGDFIAHSRSDVEFLVHTIEQYQKAIDKIGPWMSACIDDGVSCKELVNDAKEFFEIIDKVEGYKK